MEAFKKPEVPRGCRGTSGVVIHSGKKLSPDSLW